MYSPYIDCIKTNLQVEPELWTFKSNNEYKSILEHLSVNESNEYLSILTTRFNTLFENNKSLLIELCNENDLYGSPKKASIANFTNCSPSNLRYILHSFIILKYMSDNLLNNMNIIEIGGGYGGLCFYIQKLAHLFNIQITTYTLFDLLEASKLQKIYLNKLNIHNVNCFHIDFFENLKNDSFLISNYAFSELSMDLQKEYTDKIINKYTTHGFLAWNGIPVYDFTNNKIITKEQEYPLTGNNNFYVTFKPE